MNEDYFLKDILISAADFKEANYQEYTEGINNDGYYTLSSIYNLRANNYFADGNLVQTKINRILYCILSMEFNPDNVENPFTPKRQNSTSKTFTLSNLTPELVFFLSDIIDNINNNLLKSRIADICWIMKETKSISHALTAIKNYMTINITENGYTFYGKNCLKRASVLILSIKDGAKDLYDLFIDKILSYTTNSNITKIFYIWEYSDLLLNFCISESQINDIIKHHYKEIDNCKTVNDYCEIDRGYKSLINWHNKSNNYPEEIKTKIAQGFNWVDFAESFDNHIARHEHINTAINILKKIPKKYRVEYHLDIKIAELTKLYKSEGIFCLSEMYPISHSTDITEKVKQTKSIFTGFSNSSALEYFIRLQTFADVSNFKLNLLSPLFTKTTFDNNGRTVAKNNGQDTFKIEIYDQYKLHIAITYGGYIKPALEQLQLLNNIPEHLFYEIVYNSPFVPKERKDIVSKGLFMGYCGDFVSAIHILVPQFEHCIRHLLQLNGEITTKSDEGIEVEVGLSSLIKNPKLNSILGESIKFEIEAIFCTKDCYNLRNDLAHGLVNYSDCHSSFAVYSWYFILKLIGLSYYNTIDLT